MKNRCIYQQNPANWALNKGELHTGKSKGKSGYMTGAGIDNSNIMLEESTGVSHFFK